MAIGKPWIKGGPIDKLDFTKVKVRFEGDSISLQECFEMIANRINEAEEEKQKAKEKVERYENEINADSRVQELSSRLEEAYKDLRRSFQITESETKAISEWKEKHDIEQHGLNTLDKKLRAGGAIGGRYHYEFHPTSIGTAGDCVCGSCQNKAFQEAKGDRERYKKLLKKYDAIFEFSEL